MGKPRAIMHKGKDESGGPCKRRKQKTGRGVPRLDALFFIWLCGPQGCLSAGLGEKLLGVNSPVSCGNWSLPQQVQEGVRPPW